jgi:hypothetical protein
VAVFVDCLVEVALVVVHDNIQVFFIVLVGEERIFHGENIGMIDDS